MKPINEDHFELSTGKQVYAHGLMLGISRDPKGPNGFSFGYGWDGCIYLDGHDYVEERDCFTHEEQVEFAKYALKMWQEFLNRLEIREDERL